MQIWIEYECLYEIEMDKTPPKIYVLSVRARHGISWHTESETSKEKKVIQDWDELEALIQLWIPKLSIRRLSDFGTSLNTSACRSLACELVAMHGTVIMAGS